MVVQKYICGYEEYKKSVKEHKKSHVQVNYYFTGEKDDGGHSWCPDCVYAEPIVLNALEEFGDKDSMFIVVDVGNRDFWKNLKNDFRLDHDLQLTVIPTLKRLGSVVRLTGDQCAKIDLLEMFFKESSEE